MDKNCNTTIITQDHKTCGTIGVIGHASRHRNHRISFIETQPRTSRGQDGLSHTSPR